MSEAQWIQRIGPGLATLGAVAVLAATTLGATVRPWAPPACDGAPAAPPGAERTSTGAWYREDPVLADGELIGNQVSIGLADGGQRLIALDAESFAAGPYGDTVLLGTDDGHSSRLSLVAVARDCAWPVATSSDVIRRATLAADGLTVYEMRVDRTTRADLGVWRRPLDGGGEPERVLEPLAPDARFGRTFATEFTWSSDGAVLAVRSCGEIACRVRVLDPESGEHRLIDDPSLGDVIGLADDRLVIHGACRGLPCPIVSVALDGGSPLVLDDAAGLATLTTLADGSSRVIMETGHGGRQLRSVSLDGEVVQDLGLRPEGQRLVPSGGRAARGVALPPGWIAFDASGPSTHDQRAPRARDILASQTVRLDEVPR